MRAGPVLAAWAVVAVASVAAVLGLAGRGGDGARDEFRGSTPPGRIELPSFRLRDQAGRVVASDRLRGRAVVVTFLESRCREACPVIASHIARGLSRLSPPERRQAVAVALSVHPRDDTRASVRAFLRKQRAGRALRYLIGSEAELRPAWRAFAVLPALDSGDANVHSASVRIYDRDGVWVSTLHAGVDLTPASLAHDVRLALER